MTGTAGGTTLGNLGLALREVRRFEEAITAHQDAAAIYRATGTARAWRRRILSWIGPYKEHETQ
jgi:hypothetical protein